MADDITIKVLIDPTEALRGLNQVNAAMKNVKGVTQKAAKEGIGKFEKQVRQLHGVNRKVADSMKELSASIAAIQGPLGPIAGRITTLSMMVRRLGVATTVTVASMAGFVAALKNIVDAGSNAETELNTLRGIIRSTGKDTQFTAESLDQMAMALGEATLTSASEARKTQGILLTYRNVNERNLARILSLTQDVASLGFGSMSTAARALGKALDDPGRGMDSLRRLGVLFTESQKLQIQAWAATGQEARAYVAILDLVEERVGGTAIAAAEGLSGKIDTLGESFTNLKTSIYNALIASPIGQAFTNAITATSNFITKIRLGIENIDQIRAVMTSFSDDLKEHRNIIRQVGIAMGVAFAPAVLGSMASAIKGVSHAMVGLGKHLLKPFLMITALTAAIVWLEQKFGSLEGAIKRLKDWIVSLLPELEDLPQPVQDAFNKIGGFFDDLSTKAEDSWEQVVGATGNVADGIEDKLSPIVGVIQAIFNKVNKIFDQHVKDQKDALSDAGKNIDVYKSKYEKFAKGFGDQINRMTIKVGDSIENMGKEVADVLGPGGKLEDGLTDALVNFGNFRDNVNSIANDVAASIYRMTIARPLVNSISGAILDFVQPDVQSFAYGTNPGGNLTSTPLAGRANGGDVRAGKSYIVGERGREIFTPSSNGSITSNESIKGQDVNVNFTVVANDAASFRSSMAQNQDLMINTIEKALNRQGRSMFA